VPVGNVLVGNAGGNIKHDDTALAVDVVTVTETTELLLASSIPDIELNLTKVLLFVSCRASYLFGTRLATYGRETEGVDLDTEGSKVLLLEFSSQVALDKGGLIKGFR
jgi:hypothetical protein